MNFESDMKSLGFCETVFESAAEDSVECEVNLPDYCPEIKRIIKCCLKTNLTGVQRLDGKINAQLNACIRVIYLGENNKISAYEHIQHVQKVFESDKIRSDSVVSVKVKTDYINCRATSPRKLDVKAMLSFTFKMLVKSNETILTSADGCGIETLVKEFTYFDLKAVNEKSFDLTEVAEIPSAKSSVGRIIDSSAYIAVTNTKVINNKMLLKGDCCIKVIYLSDGDATVEITEHSIPVSQIIEIDGITDECETNLDLSISACEAVAKIDSSGEARLIDFNIRASALVTAFENTDVSLISDLYSTSYNTDNTVKYVNMLCKNTDFSNTFTNKVTLESIGVSVDRVCAVWCEDLKHNYTFKNKKCVIHGSYLANILFIDGEKQHAIIQKTVEFEYGVDLNNETENIVCYPSLQIGGCSCTASGESRLELKTEIYISGKVLSSQTVRCISAVDITDDNEKRENCALTVYFSESEEKIWDIAKKYKTSVRAVMQENELDSDIVENKRILLIPSV